MKKLTFIFSITLTLSAFAQVPNYVPTDGLVGWWPFNGNANDESGNNNNGTANGAIMTADRFGIANKAYSFDGVDDFIQIVAQSTIPQQSDYTLSLWFRSPTSTFNGPFVSFYSWFCTLGHDFPGLFYKDEIGNQSNTWYVQQHYYTEPTVNIWHQLLLKKTNNNLELYLDTLFIGNIITYGFSNFNPTSLIQFGYYCCQNYYEGLMDDIGIWNRALSQTEIATLYNGCSNSLSAQPTDQSIELSAGNTAQFSTTSSATTASYQWQTNIGLGFQNLSDAGQYSGSTTNTLSVDNVTIANHNQQFRCIVADGSCEDTTDVAVLTVIDDLGIDDVKPNGSKKLLKITDLNGKETPFRKNTVMLFIYEDGTVERVYEGE